MSLRKVRVVERLKIKIAEAKNLPVRSHGSHDAYCVLSLDTEEIFRTKKVERDPNAFFGEEFQFDVPRTFRFLSLYVFDGDRPMKWDKALGKVSVKKEELHKYDGKDHWFPLLPVDADSEVQGKAHIEIQLDASPRSLHDYVGLHYRILVRVRDCSDLTVINGSCDPYAAVSLFNGSTKVEMRKTKVRKKTTSPCFDDVFCFELSPRGQNHDRDNAYQVQGYHVDQLTIQVNIWHDLPGMQFGHVFLGEVNIPVGQVDLTKTHSAWYLLQPRNTSRMSQRNLGSVRLRINYASDYVFSSHFYDSLRELLLRSSSVEPITSSCAYLLWEMGCVDAVEPLVKIFVNHKQMVNLLRSMVKWEMARVTDTTTIFRGNTLVSKLTEALMRLVGMPYLSSTLRPPIERILREKKPCEVDPTRFKDKDSLQTNTNNLKEYIDLVLSAITSSALNCPHLMCQSFHAFKELASKSFPDAREVRYSVISGFIFLRFFAPAILGPKLFDLTTDTIDSQSSRTLTLISKAIQSLGNVVSSRTTSPFVVKEEYMRDIYKDFFTIEHTQSVKDFLEIISSSSVGCHDGHDTPVLLKEGIMTKRAQGRKRFGVKNFKKRYFCITTHELSYSKSKGENSLCSIPLDQILAVERVQEESFKMKNMFQVVQLQRTLYIQANNCVEAKEWMDILTKVCEANYNWLKQFHPGAYLNGHWLCCKSVSESAAGCRAVSTRMDTDLCLQIDSDREMQRLHSLLVRHGNHVNRLTEECECQAVYMGVSPSSRSVCVTENPQTCLKTLTAINHCVNSLEKEHTSYQRLIAKETQYGSKQAPIGDDNYLLLAAKAKKYDNNRKTN